MRASALSKLTDGNAPLGISNPCSSMIDREIEQAYLRELLERGQPQLVLMTGRRRVGKTYLLNRTWAAGRVFYFTAAETTPSQNREALLVTFAEWSGETITAADYPNWRTVFRLLIEYRAPEPLAIIIDEFQYLAETPRELASVASELNAVWETRRPARPLVLVLAGSAVRTLENLNAGGSPLYGRFGWQHQLRPFDYFHAGEMSAFQNERDQAYAYGIFGGTPRYLATINPLRTVAENAQAQMLDPRGEVRELVRTALLQEQGLRDIPKYVAILRAIGNGRTTLNEIAQGSGLQADTPLRDKLERLLTLDYISERRNLGAPSNAPFRYRVSDPAFRFFYEFVAPWESMLATQSAQLIWKNRIEGQRLNTYMGMIFESMVREAYYRLQPTQHLPLVAEWGRWEGQDRHRRPVEMDVASQLADGRVLTGAIKWNTAPIDVAVHTEHLAMLDRLADSGVAWAHAARAFDSPLLYVAANGFTPRFRKAASASRQHVYLWTLRTLY